MHQPGAVANGTTEGARLACPLRPAERNGPSRRHPELLHQLVIRLDALAPQLQLHAPPLHRHRQIIEPQRLPSLDFRQPFPGAASPANSASAPRMSITREIVRAKAGWSLPAEQRQEFVADAVSLEIQQRIGGVLAVADAALGGILGQRYLRLVQQWPHQLNPRVGW